jgi:hypothetical protein
MKTKPVGIRFEEGLLASMASLGVSTHQQAVNFLTKFWQENGVRVASSFAEIKKAVEKGPEKKALPYASIKQIPGGVELMQHKEPVSATIALVDTYLGEKIPKGLSGIDLTIWKADVREQRKK